MAATILISGCKGDPPLGWALSGALLMSWPAMQMCVAAGLASDLLVDEPPRRSRAPYSTWCSRQSNAAASRKQVASKSPAFSRQRQPADTGTTLAREGVWCLSFLSSKLEQVFGWFAEAALHVFWPELSHACRIVFSNNHLGLTYPVTGARDPLSGRMVEREREIVESAIYTRPRREFF